MMMTKVAKEYGEPTAVKRENNAVVYAYTSKKAADAAAAVAIAKAEKLAGVEEGADLTPYFSTTPGQVAKVADGYLVVVIE